MSVFDQIRSWGPAWVANHGYYWLPVAGIVLAALAWLLWSRRLAARLDARTIRIARRALLVVLIAVAAFSVVVYNNFFSYHYGGYLNAYEFFHYYMGSKYSAEVGYFDMYGAALVADEETGRSYRPRDGLVRDLRTLRFVPVDEVLDDGERYRRSFSDKRWRQWVSDVSFFKQRLGEAAWNRILRDRGYNATPVWTMIVGGGLSNRVPTASGAGMTFLALLDVLLLAAAFACVALVFGPRQALLMVIFIASSYLMAHVHMKGAFLRTDFVVALVLAACALKRNHHATAGALVGYATTSRVFPAIFAAGLAVRLLWDLRPGAAAVVRSVRERSLHLRFFAGFGAAVGILFLASLAYAGGAAWSDFAMKISVHRAEYHIWNVGLPSVVGAELEAPGGGVRNRGALEDLLDTEATFGADTLRGRRPWLWLVQAGVMLLWLLAIFRLEDHDVLALGFVPVFVVVAPTYYYYVVLLLPFLFLAQRLDRASGAIGLVYLFVFGMAGYWSYQRWDQYFTTYYWSSWFAFGLALYLLAVALAERRASSARGPVGVSSPTGG
jgi:hypothetical protein